MDKIKVRLEYLPDGHLNIYDIKEGVGEVLASWSPDDFPDKTAKSRHNEGSIYNKITKERITVKGNKREWLNKVKEIYDFDNNMFLASSWRGGGLLHKTNVENFLFPKQAQNKAIHAWYAANPSKDKLKKKKDKLKKKTVKHKKIKSNTNQIRSIRIKK